MAKVIRLKQSDFQKIIKNIIEEQSQEFDDFDTKIQPEELPGANDYEDMEDMDQEPQGKMEVNLAQDDEGNFFIFDKEGNVLAKTK
jgi:hypothetical protein